MVVLPTERRNVPDATKHLHFLLVPSVDYRSRVSGFTKGWADCSGLSMACGVCNHRTHSKCFKTHCSPFQPTCPSCPCHCLEVHGFTFPIIAVPLPPRAVKGTLNRLNVPATASAAPGPVSSRTTQSLAEHLKAYSTYNRPGQSQLSKSSESSNSALGLDTGGDRTPTIANTAAAGNASFAAAATGGDVRTGLFSKPLAGVWKGWAGEG